MFTIDQIKQAHSKVKSGADFPKYIQELKLLGVEEYENFVSDGRTVYHGSNNYTVAGPAKYSEQVIADVGNKDQLQRSLSIHQAGKTTYLEFCKEASENGVKRWVVRLGEMTCTYYDTAGNIMVTEKIAG